MLPRSAAALFALVLLHVPEAAPAPAGAPELPRPDLARNTFILIVGKSGKPETTWDAEAEEVYAKLGPGRLYVRLWYDGPCSPEIQKKHNGYRPWMWNSPLDDKAAAQQIPDRRLKQWNQKNELVPEAARKSGGNPADSDLTPSGYAREAYDDMLEQARSNAEGYARARERGDRTFLFAGPNEFEYVFFDSEKFAPDYSPFAVAEFRDWLSHRGEYAKGGRFEGRGRPGGEAFSDDPSPAASKGGNPPFNAAFRTRFATWQLAYWDPQAFPDRLPMEAPGMPGPRERGFTPGGFDAPRKPGEPLWDRFQNGDPKDPGYRQWRIHESLKTMFKIARDAGIPREEIWTRHRGLSPYVPGAKDERPNVTLPSWIAVTPDNMAGYNVYGLKPERSKTDRMMMAAAAAKAAGAQFGTLEWHPSLDPAFKATEQEFSHWLECWWEAGARVVGCRQWLGQNEGKPSHGVGQGAMRIRDTGFDVAIRKFLASRPDIPWGSNPAQPYVPPRVRGLAIEGKALTWKDELWDGEPFPFAAWGEFGTFEVASCARFGAKGEPLEISPIGKSRSAKLEWKAAPAKPYLIVRALTRGGGAGAWSEGLEVPP